MTYLRGDVVVSPRPRIFLNSKTLKPKTLKTMPFEKGKPKTFANARLPKRMDGEKHPLPFPLVMQAWKTTLNHQGINSLRWRSSQTFILDRSPCFSLRFLETEFLDHSNAIFKF